MMKYGEEVQNLVLPAGVEKLDLERVVAPITEALDGTQSCTIR